MPEIAARVTRSLFAICSLVFLALYVTGLAWGAEPELALLRAGIAGTLLAALARLAVWIMDEAMNQREEAGADMSLSEPLGRSARPGSANGSGERS
jgi:hypothetical protein